MRQIWYGRGGGAHGEMIAVAGELRGTGRHWAEIGRALPESRTPVTYTGAGNGERLRVWFRAWAPRPGFCPVDHRQRLAGFGPCTVPQLPVIYTLPVTDPIQHALHSAATQSPVLTVLAVFCAVRLLFVLVALMAVQGVLNLSRLTWTVAARVVVSLAVATLLTLLLNHVVTDVRPYVAEHYVPLAHVANDNGFPSDHTLIAALLVCWTWWIDRRWLGIFIVGLLAVLVGRLGVGAHHTLDVLGSLVFAAAGFGVAQATRLPADWNGRRLLPVRQHRL